MSSGILNCSWFALSICAFLWALVATISVAFSAYLYRSLPRMDLCFGHHISSLLALLIFGDYGFGCLFCQFIPQPSPPIILNHHLPLGITLRMQVSALKFLQCDGTGCIGGPLKGWFLLTGLQWNLSLLCFVFSQLWWHQLQSSSSIIGHEFNPYFSPVFPLTRNQNLIWFLTI